MKYKFILLPVLAIIFFSCVIKKPTAEDYWSSEAKLPGRNAQITAADEILPPFTKSDNTKFRIGIIISAEYWEYFDMIKGMVEGFANIGWAKNPEIPLTIKDSYHLIEWLSNQNYSDYVEFPPEQFYNLEWGDNASFVENRVIKQRPDVDLFLACGSMAGKLLYQQERYPIPVIADAINDCFAMGVTLSETDSGRDFFTNKIDREQFRRQIRLFHEITKFNKLGIVYGDDEYGISYGAVRDVEAVAEEIGFEIIRNTNIKEDINDDTVELYLAALEDVASRADAVYIGASTAVTEYNIMQQITKILVAAKIPSFSLEGSIRVKDGILFSMASSAMIRSGIFNAIKATRIFSGVSPRLLEQRFESMSTVSINLETANRINFIIPLDIIINSDEVYTAWNQSAPVNRYTGKKLSGGFTNYAASSELPDTVYLPIYKAAGTPFRIAVIQSGEYWEYNEHFRAIISGFVNNGWAYGNTIVPSDLAINNIIRFLGKFSDYIEFPPEYILNLEWGDNLKTADRFFADHKPDVDLIIAFGGVAGRLFSAYKEYPIPVLMEGITDPVGAGIIYSLEDSGKNFVTCRVDPGQYQRQVQLFHEFTGFKNLGLIYGDNEDGRSYSAVNDVEIVARRLESNIIRNTNVKEVIAADTPGLYLAALRDICRKADAVYIGASTAITEYDIMNDVVTILNEAKIPSFALEGDIRVRQGIMLGISTLEIEKFGLYNANKIAAIFHGVSPRMLKQTLEGMPSIILNLDTTQKIGFQLPLDILSTVDQLVYQGIVIKP